jgi:hypothetical protein
MSKASTKKVGSTYFSTGKGMTVTDGWPLELADAEAATKESRSAVAFLRVARASRTMRQWKKCVTNAQLGLALWPNEREKR